MAGIDRPWCLLVPEGRNLTAYIEGGEIRSEEHGHDAREMLYGLDDFVCFTPEPKAILALGDARHFVARQRRERILDITLDGGIRIRTIPNNGTHEQGGTGNIVGAFSLYCEWLRGIGVVFDKRAGWGTLGRRIWSLTDGPQKFHGPDKSRLAFYGGRKQAPYPMLYQQAQHFDITGAYLNALGRFPIPSRLKACPPGEWSVSDLDGICFASVAIPDSIGEWLPLPIRADKRIVRLLRFPSGEVEGCWTFSELRMAYKYGCKVSPILSYAGQHSTLHFAKWFSTMLEGRGLVGGASIYAKHHANLLWSSFATSPSRLTWKEFDDEYAHRPRIIKTQEPGSSFTVRSAFVSAIIASRVREQLYGDVLCPGGNPNLYVIHCDTDGIVTGTKHNLPPALKNLGGEPGQWRRTTYMPFADIRSPNAYRYTCPTCGNSHPDWHYSCAGATNPDTAKKMFKNEPRTQDALDLDSLDPETLPEVLAEYKPKKRRRMYETV